MVPASKDQTVASLLDRLVRRSRAMLLAERLWRLGVALAALALVFVALSWSGLWLAIGPRQRMAGVALFALVGLILVAREFLRGPPRRAEALARLDEAEARLRPAASLEDRLAGDDPDPATAALWEAHRRRLARALAAAPVAGPNPDLPRRDPYALRALALLAAVAAGFAAGADKTQRFAAAFDWRGVDLPFGSARLDAYFDPPPYTGRAPIVLGARDIGQKLDVPVNSVLHVRGDGGTVEGALTPLAPAGTDKPAEAERQYKLAGEARLVLSMTRAYAFTAIPDLPPSIELTAPPRLNLRGSMTLGFKTDDDYGVIAAEAQLSRPGARRSLYGPPELPLTPPAEREGRGEAKATLDLSESPWAGATATLTLKARDEGGNEGASQPVDITLPQRFFKQPLARALAEQRRNLALDPEDRARVSLALQALSLAPDLFGTPSSIYLGLRVARRQLEGTRSDDELREVCDLLWAMALSLEDGDLVGPERDLRAAERNLREALARGADEEEVAKLTQELRDAMQKFLQGMAQQKGREGDASRKDDGSKHISKDDLDRLLDEINEANKSGDADRAQALLDQLANIMENLRPGSGQGKSARAQDRARGLSELDKLSREQQQLRDETFQGMTQGGGRPQSGQGAGDKQRGLRQRLEREREALRRSGDGAPGELGEAAEAMREAERALEQGPGGANRAVDAQGRALQALRRGADELTQRFADQPGAEGDQGADHAGDGESGNAREAGKDPLGRETGRGFNSRSRYDPMGAPPALRAHRVQEELRRRLSQPGRPPEELDYLQRLLKR